MNTTPDPDAAEQLEVQAGRRAPFSMNPDWVLLSGVTRDALAVYWALAAHVNQQRGDAEVWPTQDQLARIVGYANRKDVQARIKELIEINAVEKRTERTHGGMRSRTIYTVHQSPPDGWSRPESMKDFYRALKLEFSQVAPDDPHRGRPDAPHRGRPSDPLQGRPSDPTGGQEQDEPELEELELDGDSLRSSVPRTDAGASEAPGDDASGADGRTDGGDSSNKKPKSKKNRKAVRVQGEDISLTTVSLPDERVVEVTDEHRELANELWNEGDTDWTSRVTALMSRTQTRQLRDLLPRACAIADPDRVRGFLHEKVLFEAHTAVYVLGAFADDRIEDVIETSPVSHPDIRAERARQARETAELAAEVHEERTNALAEGHWGQASPWAPQNGSQAAPDPWAVPSADLTANDNDAEDQGQGTGQGEPEGSDPVLDVVAAAGLDDLQLSPVERGVVRNVLADHGHEAVVYAFKHVVREDGVEGLHRELRSARGAGFRRTVADLNR